MELGPDQVQVALGLVLVDLGEQFGLRAAQGGSVALCSCHGDMFQVQFRGEDASGPVGKLDREGSAQGTEADRVVRDGREAETLARGAVDPVPEPGPADVECEPSQQQIARPGSSWRRTRNWAASYAGPMTTHSSSVPPILCSAERLALDDHAGQPAADEAVPVVLRRTAAPGF